MAFEQNRINYISQIDSQSSAEESDGPTSSAENQSKNNVDVEMRFQPQRKPKCFSKNAQLARENRLKKKIHLAKLEKETHILKKDKSRMSTVIESQSLLITQLKNEVRYLRGVLANSSDISKLIRNIQQGTGMSVSTSLNKSFKINESCSSRKAPISKKTMCPWEEDDNLSQIPSLGMYSNQGKLCDDLDLDVPLNDENDLTPFLFDRTDSLFGLEDTAALPNSVLDSFEEHNYTRTFTSSINLEELQICLLMLLINLSP